MVRYYKQALRGENKHASELDGVKGDKICHDWIANLII